MQNHRVFTYNWVIWRGPMFKTWKKALAVVSATAVLATTLPGLALASSTDPLDINYLHSLFTGKFFSAPDTVPRIAGSDRYQTAAEIAQQGWADGSSEYAVLSAGMDENLVDALTAAPLASQVGAPILLTEGDHLNSNAKAELERLGVTTVYVTSGPGVIKPSVLTELQEMAIGVISLGGLNRFETAINIAQEIGDFNQVIVSTAWSNADALSVAALAANQGIPILLSDVDQLPSEVVSYLSPIASQLEGAYVLGGVGVLSDNVKNALPNPTRLGGSDRYATNMEIIKAFIDSIRLDKVYIASGNDKNLVDALAGAALAAQTASPMVLVDKSGLAPGTRAAVKADLFPLFKESTIALGGEGVVPSVLVDELTSFIKYRDFQMTVSPADGIRAEMAENIVITGTRVTLVNLTTPYNVYVEGSEAVLNGVHAKTIILNPGGHSTEKATLKNVHAETIVVLSAPSLEGITLENTTAQNLVVVSPSNAGVVLKGNTALDRTIIGSHANLDAQSGSFGPIIMGNPLEISPTFELNGTYTQDVFMSDGSIATGAETTIPVLTIAPRDAQEKIAIEGNYGTVQVLKPGIITIGANSQIDNLVTTAGTRLDIRPGAVIKQQSTEGSSVYIDPGNVQSNMNNLGIAAASDDWIYYRSSLNNAALYKMKPDGTQATKVLNDSVAGLSVIGDTLYFNQAAINNFSFLDSLCQMPLDGSTSYSLVSTGAVPYVYAVSDQVFYGSGSSLAIDTPGFRASKIITSGGQNYVIHENYIYFRQVSVMGPNPIHRVRLDGTDETSILDKNVKKFSISDNKFYYISLDDRTIYSATLDGLNPTQLTQDRATTLNVHNGWIYYTNKDDSDKIYKMRIDGTERTRLSEKTASYINVVGDWIFYTGELAAMTMDNSVYMMKLDGTENRKI